MYKVVSLSLTILFLFALLLSVFGIISYSPLALIASFSVLGTGVYATSLLFGVVFGIRIHGESSYITSSILFFIFTPTLELPGLLTLGLIAMIAASSKFLLAYRGRHIFNAAAVSAFIIGLTGLAYASWWVATPPLIPLTLLLGLAVVQKTRRVQTSSLFLLVATTLVTTVLLSYGSSLQESLVLLLSWPLVFFACFMLTEPLTIPPKKWQQTIVVLVVAVLFAIPIHIGSFTTNPALALIIGNLIAFCFSKRSAIALKFQESKQLTPTTKELTFTSLRKLTYEPGQYMELTLSHTGSDLRGMRRTFSITSIPNPDNTVHFGVKFYEPSSTFKKALQSLPIGSIVQATGINGDFTLPKDPNEPLLFIAGGIGITPFVSHLRHLIATQQKRDIILFYSVSDPSEVAYRDVLLTADITVIIVTKCDKMALPEHWVHINASFITKEIIAVNTPQLTNRRGYISGPPAMVDGAKVYLKQLGMRNIKTDYFIGY